MLPSFFEVVLILLIAVLVLGSGKLPRVLGELGRGLRALASGLKPGDRSLSDPS